MAIAFDAASTGTIDTSTSLTFSHTCTGSNRIIFVSVGIFGGFTTDVLTGITYAGVSMTRVGMGVPQSNNRTYLYYLIAPATGANNVIVSSSASTSIRGTSMSYTDAKQTGQPDASNSGNGAGTTITGTVTVVANNSWLVGSFYDNSASLAASTGTTSRGIPSSGGGARNGGFDSNGALSSGSNSLVVTGANDNNAYVVASFAPATPATTIKTWDGVARANVKTLDGVASASIKTINGIS